MFLQVPKYFREPLCIHEQKQRSVKSAFTGSISNEYLKPFSQNKALYAKILFFTYDLFFNDK